MEIVVRFAHRLGLMVYRYSIEVSMKKIIPVIVMLLFFSGCEFWKVDKCLDGGGRWNYEKEVCEFEDNVQPENEGISGKNI